MKDRRGRELEPGQTVAYNQSGQIAYGEIVYLEEGVPHLDYKNAWKKDPLIKVRNLDGVNCVKISKVRNPLGVLVIEEVNQELLNHFANDLMRRLAVAGIQFKTPEGANAERILRTAVSEYIEEELTHGELRKAGVRSRS
jgi:hypothetical protein